MIAELVEQRFAEAIELPASERMAFLELACASDPELFRHLTAMLESHARAERVDFFASKASCPATEQPGQRIGPYILRERLGEGGWGVVFLAEQEKPVRRQVALKLIKAGLDTRNVVARFEAEREALSRMDHPNIARVLDAGATELGRPYFVMELVAGPRITDYCDRKGLGVVDRLELFAKVCQAAQHAHQKGIIHRDLKPSNILVTEHDGEPEPKIIDFGIAKAIERRLTDFTAYTGGPHLLGTPAYMSPEQTVTPNIDVDTRSDIYSLGVLLYELLAGRTPFDSTRLHESTWEEMCRTIREEDPPRPSVRLATLTEREQTGIAMKRGCDPIPLAHRVRGDLDWIVMKCLAKERAGRYETANALALDVRRHLAAEPIMARPPSATYRLQRLVVRHRIAIAAMGAVALGLIVGLTAAVLGFRAARIERDSSELKLYAADMNAAAQALSVRNQGRAFDLLRPYQPTAGRRDVRGWEWNYLWKLCQTEDLFSLAGHSNRVPALAFTPDNKTLVSGDTAGLVNIWNLDTKEAVGTYQVGRLVHDLGLAIVPNGQAFFIGWMNGAAVFDGPNFTRVRSLPGAKGPLAIPPDGRMLVTAGADAVIIWEPGSLKELHRSSAGQGKIPTRSTVVFSQDGRMVAIPLQVEERIEVKVWDAAALRENGFREPPISVLERTDTRREVNGLAFSNDGQILATGQINGQHGVQLWDPRTGRPLSPLESGVKVLGLRFLPDGHTLLTFGLEQNFRLWDISTRTNLVSLRAVPGHENEIWSTAVAPGGRLLASGDKDGIIKVWNTGAFLERPRVKDRIEVQGLEDFSFSRDGRAIQTISSGSVLGSWDAETLQPQTITNVPRAFRQAEFSPQGTQIALALTNGAIEVWRVFAPDHGPRLIQELLPARPLAENGRSDPVLPLLCWSGDGNKLATYVTELQVWNIAHPQARLVLSLPAKSMAWLDPVSKRWLYPEAIALSPNGKILATAAGMQIQLWDGITGGKLSTCIGHQELIHKIVFSPDGRHLASASTENKAMLWEVPDGKRKSTFSGFANMVSHLSFSHDGRTLVTRDADAHAMKLWHVQTGRELMTIEMPFPGWGSQVAGVKFSPEGSLMAVVSPANHIRLLRAPSLAGIQSRPGQRHPEQRYVPR